MSVDQSRHTQTIKSLWPKESKHRQHSEMKHWICQTINAMFAAEKGTILDQNTGVSTELNFFFFDFNVASAR
jgi:hypothetical protein